MSIDYENILKELKDSVVNYVQLKAEWLKLSMYEKVASLVATLAHNVILIIFGLFSCVFLLTSLGFWLGTLLNSFALGFLLVFALCLIILFLLLGFKNAIKDSLKNIVIKSFEDDDYEESDENNLENMMYDENK